MKYCLLVITVVILSAFSTVSMGHNQVNVLERNSYPVDDWNMFHHDAMHTGNSTSTAPDTNNTIWRSNLGAGIQSSPVVSDRNVYVGTDSGSLYCLDENSGGEHWHFPTALGVKDSPAVAYGMVYFGCEDGKLYALNAGSGDHVWNYTTGSSIYSSPTVQDGMVFFGSNDGKVYALNATTGAYLWNFTTGGAVSSSPAYVNGLVFTGSNDGHIYAIYASNGTECWGNSTGNATRSSPLIYGPWVYIGNDGGFIYAFDAQTGAFVWSNMTGGPIYSSPAAANGLIYVGSNDQRLYAFRCDNGDQWWNVSTGGSILTSPAIADGNVFIGSLSGGIYAFNASSGAPIWDCSMDSPSSPAISDGKLFVGSQDNNVYCFGPGLPVLEETINAPSSMPAGQTEMISVTIISSDTGNPVQNAKVDFSATGGSFNPYTGFTNDTGYLNTYFTAPIGPSSVTVTVNSSEISHNDGTASTDIAITALPPMTVNITANPSTIESGGKSTLLVHVSDPSSGSDISGAHVVLNVSEGTLSNLEGDTQPTGDFNSIYSGVLTSVAKDVTVNAIVNKTGFQTEYAIGHITISPKLNVTLDTNMTLLVESGKALITVHVTDVTAHPVAIASADITLSVSTGSISPATGSTDSTGSFNAIFTAPILGSVSQIICQISANATKSGFIYDNSTIDISVVNKTTPVLLASVTADPTTIPSGGSSTVTITVRSSTTSQPINNATVTLKSDSSGTFSQVNAVGAGRYVCTFTAPTVSINKNIKITATAVAQGFFGQGGGEVTIMVTTSSFENFTIAVSALPTSINSDHTSNINVTLKGQSGEYVSGASLTFASYPTGASFDVYYENTTNPGYYYTIFHPPQNLQVTTNFTIHVTASKANFNGGVSNNTYIYVTPTIIVIPICTITSPKDGAEVSSIYLISGNASSSGISLVSVQVQIVLGDGTPSANGWVNATGLTQWYYNWDTSALQNGDYKIYARSYNGKAYSTDAVVSVTVNSNGSSSVPGFEIMSVLVGILTAFVAVSFIYIYRRKDRLSK